MSSLHSKWILPDWPAPSSVRAFVTTRHGGVSSGTYASLNLGDAVGDAAENVAENRRRLESCLPSSPKWLRQVHGNNVVCAEEVEQSLEADAATARRENVVCTVMAADCLPVLLCDRGGTVVAAVHAGWRGLAAGVIENAVKAMQRPGEELLAFLGPAIGPAAFEVGQEVRAAFIKHDARAEAAFRAHQEGKWLADLFVLARQRLLDVEVRAVYGGTDCTYTDPGRFFSHRRDRVSGRMAALIWLARPDPTA